jgi:hypothetical protein
LIKNYDDWKLDTPDNHLKVKGICCHCDQELYGGEEAFRVEDGLLHEDCFEEYAKEVLIISREEL